MILNAIWGVCFEFGATRANNVREEANTIGVQTWVSVWKSQSTATGSTDNNPLGTSRTISLLPLYCFVCGRFSPRLLSSEIGTYTPRLRSNACFEHRNEKSWWHFKWHFVPEIFATRCSLMQTFLYGLSSCIEEAYAPGFIFLQSNAKRSKLDLKSAAAKAAWGFKSPSGHQNPAERRVSIV